MREKELPATEKLPASEVTGRWSELIEAVAAGRKRILVREDGSPLAAIISAGDFRLFRMMEDQRERDFQALFASWEAFKDVDPETAEREVAAALASVLAERREGAKRAAKSRL